VVTSLIGLSPSAVVEEDRVGVGHEQLDGLLSFRRVDARQEVVPVGGDDDEPIRERELHALGQQVEPALNALPGHLAIDVEHAGGRRRFEAEPALARGHDQRQRLQEPRLAVPAPRERFRDLARGEKRLARAGQQRRARRELHRRQLIGSIRDERGHRCALFCGQLLGYLSVDVCDVSFLSQRRCGTWPLARPRSPDRRRPAVRW